VDRGAHFFKCDFQVHSPRDANWAGERPTTDAQREAFAVEFVSACRARNLDSVAITDHHDLSFVPLIREAARTERAPDGTELPPEERLVVFPGMELTLGVPCQAILVFDADFPDDQLPLVLEALAIERIPIDTPLSDVTPLNHIDSFKRLYEDLDHREWFRGRYVVFPNVTDSGHRTLLRTGMHGKYVEMPCVGGYVDGPASSLGTGNRRIVDGRDPRWGNKRVALFQTSDARSRSFDRLGEHATWVKWATPTAEALRQACLAQESRISLDAPATPASFLTHFSVSNSKFMGAIELSLNPQYNAIIGGRGTGKSTCLEYIRWALCDQPSHLAPEDDADATTPAARRSRLIHSTLVGFEATVEVRFSINGIPHAVRRNSDTGDVLLKIGDEDFRPATEGDVRTLLPIQAYSQKQLSSVAVRLDELTRFVTAPVQHELSSVDAQTASLSGEIREAYAALQRRRVLERTIDRDELALRSLSDQATSVRDSLGAMSDEDRECLSERPKYDAAQDAIDETERILERADRAVDSFRTNVESLTDQLPVFSPDALHAEAVNPVSDHVRETLESLRAAAAEAERAIRKLHLDGSAYVRAVGEWRERFERYETRYTDATSRSSAHESRLAELADLEARQRALRTKVATEHSELDSMQASSDKYIELREEWARLHRERSTLLDRECRALTESSGGLIDASLHAGAGLEEVQNKLRSAISGSNVRTAHTDALLASVSERDDTFGAWEGVISDLEQLANFDPETDTGAGAPASPTLSKRGLSRSDIERIAARLTPDSWLDLALTPLTDHPVFRYQIREADYIDFAEASAGQQATALLRVLLSQPGPPLMIDQPEEDLDSEVVLDIVEEIWKAKGGRQLIFTSHNANLVVNGDADLVVCCGYRLGSDQSRGQIKLEGAIDIPEVRDEITLVMEGGEKAFKLRRDKYGF
jgi:ABC-type lipoprotein export system ATPase subunit